MENTRALRGHILAESTAGGETGLLSWSGKRQARVSTGAAGGAGQGAEGLQGGASHAEHRAGGRAGLGGGILGAAGGVGACHAAEGDQAGTRLTQALTRLSWCFPVPCRCWVWEQGQWLSSLCPWRPVWNRPALRSRLRCRESVASWLQL